MVKNKKGQIGGLQGTILVLIIVGVLVGVLFLVLTSLEGTFEATTNTVVNESVTPTDRGVYLAYNSTTADVNCFRDATILAVVNQSGQYPINSANYSVNPFTGLFWNVTGNQLFNRAWNVTYTYSTGSDACESVQDTREASKTIPEFLPILVIVGLVGILLAIVFKVLPGAIGGGRETAYV
jgi:hypothetical protein